MTNENNYSKWILWCLFSSGCIFIFCSLIAIALILFPSLKILKSPLGIISGGLFIFGFFTIITAIFLLKKDSTDKNVPIVYMQNQNQELFSLRTILISITALNVILFVGGTIWSGVKIDSIQERYDSAIGKMKKAEDDLDDTSSHVMEKVNDAINKETGAVKEAKEKAIGNKDFIDKNDSIEKMVQYVLNAKNNAIEKKTGQIPVFVEDVKKAKINAIDGKEGQIPALVNEVKKVKDNAIKEKTGQIPVFVEDVEKAKINAIDWKEGQIPVLIKAVEDIKIVAIDKINEIKINELEEMFKEKKDNLKILLDQMKEIGSEEKIIRFIEEIEKKLINLKNNLDGMEQMIDKKLTDQKNSITLKTVWKNSWRE